MTQTFDVAVVGGGITGLAAAGHAALGGVSVVHFLGSEGIGGLVLNVGRLEGYPAGPAPLSGLELATALSDEARRLGVEQREATVERIERQSEAFRLASEGALATARQVVVATGARHRALGVRGERELVGRGVSQCAWCDAGLYKGRRVIVAGGGDAALEAALHLAAIAAEVTVLTRGPMLRARQSYVNRLADRANVAFLWQCEVVEVLGDGAVAGVRLRDHEAGEEREHACDGLFVHVGLTPDSRLVRDLVDLAPDGSVLVDASLATRTPGLFAAGALRSGYGGRLVHAAADGATAAIAAVSRLRE